MDSPHKGPVIWTTFLCHDIIKWYNHVTMIKVDCYQAVPYSCNSVSGVVHDGLKWIQAGCRHICVPLACLNEALWQSPGASLLAEISTTENWHRGYYFISRWLRWYGHVQETTAHIKSITNCLIPGTRKQGRPMSRWSECMKTGISNWGLAWPTRQICMESRCLT